MATRDFDPDSSKSRPLLDPAAADGGTNTSGGTVSPGDDGVRPGGKDGVAVADAEGTRCRSAGGLQM